jgi:UDP-N-acetylglucosamine acyltransferase
VEHGAKLADDVRVGTFAYIGAEVTIGPGCIVENHATITGRTVIGEKNHIFPMAVIGTSADGEGQPGQCVVGDGNVIREHVTIYTGPGKTTRIGSGNLIMIACMIGPGVQLGDHGIFDNLTDLNDDAIIEDYVRTSGFTLVERGSRVGAYTFTVGYSCIDHDAPPFAMVQGFPFRVRGVNTENLRRCGFGDDDIRALKTAFRDLFNGVEGAASDEVLPRLLHHENPHVRQLAEAVRRDPARGLS